MKIYKIGHIGIAVCDPIKMANWYREVLGFEIKFAAEDSEKAVAFVTDADNKAPVELGKIPDILLCESKSSITCNSIRVFSCQRL